MIWLSSQPESSKTTSDRKVQEFLNVSSEWILWDITLLGLQQAIPYKKLSLITQLKQRYVAVLRSIGYLFWRMNLAKLIPHLPHPCKEKQWELPNWEESLMGLTAICPLLLSECRDGTFSASCPHLWPLFSHNDNT